MNLPDDIEICKMIDFRNLSEISRSVCSRVYFGHETCEKLLPGYDDIYQLLKICDDQKIEPTLVTPFLTDGGLEKVVELLKKMVKVYPDMEVVIADWGLLDVVVSEKIGTPVISRFLTGQRVDFRLNRLYEKQDERILKIDDKYYRLQYKEPGLEITELLSSCTLLKESSLSFFAGMGISRFELSNVFQPIVIPESMQFQYSLHVPFVPLTIFRTCPEGLDFNRIKRNCNSRNCNNNRSRWECNGFDKEIYCIDNALYYSNPDCESQVSRNKRINRIVYKSDIF